MNTILKEEKVYFEYHCYEGHDSGDAQLWYRSHQPVTIVKEAESDAWEGSTFEERAEAGCPRVFTIRFADGFEGDAFEDELLSDPSKYVRPDPPEAL